MTTATAAITHIVYAVHPTHRPSMAAQSYGTVAAETDTTVTLATNYGGTVGEFTIAKADVLVRVEGRKLDPDEVYAIADSFGAAMREGLSFAEAKARVAA